jgi:hypothetical protein
MCKYNFKLKLKLHYLKFKYLSNFFIFAQKNFLDLGKNFMFRTK